MYNWFRISCVLIWLLVAVAPVGYCRSGSVALPAGALRAAVVLTVTAAGSLSLCKNATTQLQTNAGTVLNPTVNWYWIKDGTRIPGKDKVPNLDINGPGEYTLGGDWESDPNVQKPATLKIAELPEPKTNINTLLPSGVFCKGNSFSLVVISPIDNYTYTWKDATETTTVHVGAIFSTSVVATYTLEVTEPVKNCFYKTTAPASLIPTPKEGYTVSFTATGNTTFCDGNTVDLVWQPTDPNVPTALEWLHNGNVTTDPINTTLVTVSKMGSYSLRDRGNGCFSPPPPIAITVGQKPSVYIVVSQPQVCKGRAYSLSVQPANAAYRYDWFDEATDKFVVNPGGSNSGTFTTTDEGPFYVKVSTPQGCSAALTGAGSVQFLPSTTLKISPAGPLSICTGTSATLAVAGGDVSAYYWTRNNGTIKVPNSDGKTRIEVSQAGTYSIGGPLPQCVTVDEATKPVVTITPLPATGIVASAGIVCRGDAFSLFPTPNITNRNYAWTDPDGQPATFPTTKVGTYRLRVTSPAGCVYTATSATSVSFRDQTTIAISASGPLVFCPGVGVTLSVPLSTVKPYSWTRNGLPIANTLNGAGYTAPQSGTYSLGGLPVCTRVSNPAVVQVHPQPTVSIVPSSLTLCEGDRAQLVAQTAQANTPRWRVNGVDPGPVRSVTANSATTVSLTVTSPQGCTRSTGLTYTPQTFPRPVIRLTSPDPIWQNKSVEAGLAPPTSGYRYEWFPPDGVADTKAPSTVFSPAQTTSYTLVATDQRGCYGTDTLLITVWEQLVVPTAFSPNADGLNDVWQIPNISRYPNAEVFIYNRWGELVYAAQPAAQPPFDGTKSGQPLPDGQYIYRVRLNFRDVEATGRLVIAR
jgi:gliding motility-associated-like protein